MNRLLIFAICLWSVEVALGGPVTQQYEVRLMRPAKANDAYHIQATCRQSEKMKIIRGGQEVKTKNVEFSLEFEAGVRILEVNRIGEVTKCSLSVTNFIKTQGEVKKTLIPKESLIMGSVTDAGYFFEVKGNTVGSEIHEALLTVIQFGKGGRWSDDEIYDSKEPQKIGNSWNINAAMASRNLAKAGIKAQVEDITGTATLKEVMEIDRTPCLKVCGEMSIRRMSAPFTPDFKVETAEMHMAYTAIFPVDINKGRLLESQEMRMNLSMRGKPDASGIEVIFQSNAERTLNTKLTYPE